MSAEKVTSIRITSDRIVLVDSIVESAPRNCLSSLRLWTVTPAPPSFYTTLGFASSNSAGHIRVDHQEPFGIGQRGELEDDFNTNFLMILT
jgi:hypothetical protein